MSTSRPFLQKRCKQLNLTPCNGTVAQLKKLIEDEEMRLAKINNNNIDNKTDDVNIKKSGENVKNNGIDDINISKERNSPMEGEREILTESRCYDLLSDIDNKFREWVEPVLVAEELEWCKVYEELQRILNYAPDESLLYAITDIEGEEVLQLIREKPTNRGYFTKNYPVLTQVLLAAGDEISEVLRGYILANGSDAYINDNEIDTMIPYITTTSMAVKLYNRYINYMRNIKEVKYSTAALLENKIRETKEHLKKRGMLLFLAQYDIMRIKSKAMQIISALYDYVVGDDDFVLEILALPKIPDWDIVLTNAAKRNAPNALNTVVESSLIPNKNISYLLTKAVEYNLIYNVNILLSKSGIDKTNGGTYLSLKIAAEKGNIEIFELLEPSPTQRNDIIIPGFRLAAIKGNNIEILSKVLLYPSEDDDEALSEAIKTKNPAFVKLLLTSSETITSWAVDGIIWLIDPDTNIDTEIVDEMLSMMLTVKSIPLPLKDENFINYISNNLSLVKILFKGRRFPPDFITSLRTAADDSDNKEVYDYIIKVSEPKK